MEEINVFLKMEDGKRKTIKTNPDNTLKQFVSQAQMVLLIRIEKIAFKGKIFKDYQYDMTLNELDIKDQSLLQIVSRLAGG